MVLRMTVTGTTGKLLVTVNSLILVVTFMLVSGIGTNRMARVCMSTTRAPGTKVSGRTNFSTEKVWRHGLRVLAMRVPTQRA